MEVTDEKDCSVDTGVGSNNGRRHRYAVSRGRRARKLLGASELAARRLEALSTSRTLPRRVGMAIPSVDLGSRIQKHKGSTLRRPGTCSLDRDDSGLEQMPQQLSLSLGLLRLQGEEGKAPIGPSHALMRSCRREEMTPWAKDSNIPDARWYHALRCYPISTSKGLGRTRPIPTRRQRRTRFAMEQFRVPSLGRPPVLERPQKEGGLDDAALVR